MSVGAWIGIAVCLIVTMVVGIVPDTVLDPAAKATPALVQVAERHPGIAAEHARPRAPADLGGGLRRGLDSRRLTRLAADPPTEIGAS